jgi:putative ABC transport system permease protein
MDWAARIRDKARQAGRDLDVDVVEELASHAQNAFDASCARGSSLAEAEAQVGQLIDGWIARADGLKRVSRRSPAVVPPRAGSQRLPSLVQDLRYAVRLVARQRGFSLIAITTMAIAIGVMTTLVSVVYGVLLKPLPWAEPDRLVRLTETRAGATRQLPLMISNLAYYAWRDRPTTIEQIGAWQRTSATVSTGGDAERVSLALVTPSVFPLLRAVPLLGQPFSRDDADELVVSFGFWQERLGADRGVLGQPLQLNGRPYTIVAVMPADFVFPDRDTQMWRPLAVQPAVAKDGRITMSTVSAMARLVPGATPTMASAEATARVRSTPEPSTNWALMAFGSAGAADILATPALDALTHDVRPGLIVMLIAVSLLLLTAVANIAGLQVARATTRLREMAIRSAIGAGTSRLVQQLMIESVLIAAAGGFAGLLLSRWLHGLLPSVLPANFPRADGIALGWTVTGFAVAVTAITGVLLGVLPALQLRHVRLAGALTDNSNGAIGGTRAKGRTVIATVQIALTCALLVGAMLLTRSFMAMVGQDRGYEPSHALSATLMLPDFAFTKEARLEALHHFVDLARTLPGHPTVALTTGLPLSGSENLTGFTMPSVQQPGTEVHAHAVRSVVTSDIVAALELHLAEGRVFQASDDSPSAPRVVVVNRTFARSYLSDRPVGDVIRNFMQGDNVPFEVIGVVDDMIRNGLRDQTQPEIYSLLSQSPGPSQAHEVVLRTGGDPGALVQPLRSLVKQLSPSATVQSVRTMEERVAGSLTRDRLYAIVLVVFGLSALVITAVGLFGVLSYVVSQRTREIALRSALGARPGQIAGLVFAHGLAMAVGGLGIGVVAAWLSARYLQTLLYGISAHDVVTYAVVAVATLVIATATCLLPAVKAVRVDPLTALRSSQ